MTREHRQQRGHKSQSEEQTDDGRGGAVEQARNAKLQDVRETRNQLKGQLSKSVRAVGMGANLFQMAVRGLSEEEKQKEIASTLADQAKDEIVDKVAEKFREGVAEASEIGEAVLSRSAGVFSAIKSTISDQIKARGELTVLEAADMIVSGMIEKATILEEEIASAIDSLPREKILGIRKTLGAFDGIEDEADSAETGRLEDGLKEWAMTDLIGLPAGDGVAIEDYGRIAFASFQQSVISSMPAADAGDAIQDRIAHPGDDQERIEAAEDKIGPEFKAGIEKDKGMRQRVAATGDNT